MKSFRKQSPARQSNERRRIVLLSRGGRLLWDLLARLRERDLGVDAIVLYVPEPRRAAGVEPPRGLAAIPPAARLAARWAWLGLRAHLRHVRDGGFATSGPGLPPPILTGVLHGRRMLRTLEKLAPDVLILAGCGLIREDVLAIPREGVINVHPGLLPWIRGNDPIAHSLSRGVPLGSSTFWVDAGIDTGRIIERRLLRVAPEETSETLRDKLHRLWVEMTADVVAAAATGPLPAGSPQAERFPLCRTLLGPEAQIRMSEALAQGVPRRLLDRWAPLCDRTLTLPVNSNPDSIPIEDESIAMSPLEAPEANGTSPVSDRPSPERPRRETHAVFRGLLRDGTLALRADASVWTTVESWLPRSVQNEEPDPARVRAWIDARIGTAPFPVPSEKPPIDLGGVLGWPDPAGRLLLRNVEGSLSAVVNPATQHASVYLAPPASPSPSHTVGVSALFTLAAAFLLGRLERTLVHAAAIVAPDQRAWLLIGSSRSGKTTTCINLISRGWDYLSDDHIILGRDHGLVTVEGWPRPFNVDDGYGAGLSSGVRSRVDPDRFGPGRWRSRAPLAGLLFPRVDASRATAISPLGPSDAMVGLLQQSPWLVADRATAPTVLDLFHHVSHLPAFALRLGTDTYRDTERLQAVLAQVIPTGMDDDIRPSAAT